MNKSLIAALLWATTTAVTLAQSPPSDTAQERTPPPRLRVPNADGVIYGVPPGTRAPDGVGVTVKRAVHAGDYNTTVLTYLPWEDSSVTRPLGVGSFIPADSVVRTAADSQLSLNEAVKRQPTVLIFYRGGWCPYCNAHLRELQKSEPELQKLGYQILAVSTDTPAEVSKYLAENKLSYTLLSDAKLQVAAKFGIRYKVSETYLSHVKQLDLRAKNGGYLLTPAAFIVDRRGVIRFAYVNNNYSVRVGQDKLLAAARDALGK
jgi:peroxiredoxin